MRKGISFLLFCLAWQVALAQANPAWLPAKDSMIQNDPGFGYMKGLDSLLHLMNAEADSIKNMKARSGHFKRSKTPSVFAALFNNPAVRFAFWIVLAVFIGYVLTRLFQFKPFGRSKTEEAATAEAEEEALKESDWYDDKIAESEAESNFMLAVRYRFLRMLAILNQDETITFTREKTNAAYASEIQDAALRKLFLQRSMIYEYVWYGKKQLTERQYLSLKNIFDKHFAHQ